MRRLLFTAVMTGVSRGLILWNRLRGLRAQAGGSDSPPEDQTGWVTERCLIPSGACTLDGRLVRATEATVTSALMICHGVGELVDHWHAVQQLLAENGVASLAFDYAGYGRSTGWIDAEQCEQDAIAAFHCLQARTPDVPVSLLGFSLGSGIAAAIMDTVKPHRLVLCAAFTSFREAAHRAGFRPLAFAVPAIWDTTEALRGCRMPVLVVHGEKDRLFPVEMARALVENCASSCELIVAGGVTHNGPIYKPQSEYWAAIATWLRKSPGASRRAAADSGGKFTAQ